MAHLTKKMKLIPTPGYGDTVDIDIGMVPMIEMCREQGIRTLYCCQGYLKDDPLPGRWGKIQVIHPENRQGYICFPKAAVSHVFDDLMESRWITSVWNNNNRVSVHFVAEEREELYQFLKRLFTRPRINNG